MRRSRLIGLSWCDWEAYHYRNLAELSTFSREICSKSLIESSQASVGDSDDLSRSKKKASIIIQWPERSSGPAICDSSATVKHIAIAVELCAGGEWNDLTHVSGLICRHKVDSNGSTNELLMNCQGKGKQNRSSSYQKVGKGSKMRNEVERKAKATVAGCVLPPDIGMNELRFILLSTKRSFHSLPPDPTTSSLSSCTIWGIIITWFSSSKSSANVPKSSRHSVGWVCACLVCAFKCSDVEKLPEKILLLRNRLCFVTKNARTTLSFCFLMPRISGYMLTLYQYLLAKVGKGKRCARKRGGVDKRAKFFKCFWDLFLLWFMNIKRNIYVCLLYIHRGCSGMKRDRETCDGKRACDKFH